MNSTVVDVSIKEKITEDKVIGILDRHIESKIDWSHLVTLGIIGIDEIAIKPSVSRARERFYTSLYKIDFAMCDSYLTADGNSSAPISGIK